MRCTCTSKIDRKIETRGRGVGSRPSSGGGTASSISDTRPSAGATTSPSASGRTRFGARKKAALAAVAASPIRPTALPGPLEPDRPEQEPGADGAGGGAR